MKIDARLFIGDILFEDLDMDQQETIKEEATDIYANQVMKKVEGMIKEGKSVDEIKKYLLLN